MAFQKGQSGNPAGRKKGTPNKTTKEIREVINSVISSSFSKRKVLRDLNELSPKQRLDYMLRLMEYVVAKPKSVEPESERPLNMMEKYSRITEYIENNFSYDNTKKKSARSTNNGSLVTIVPNNEKEEKIDNK